VYIQTGKGLLRVERLQLQSKKEMDASSFLNGNPDFIGTVLG
jgi:methionyl-tRNA formyltransferase